VVFLPIISLVNYATHATSAECWTDKALLQRPAHEKKGVFEAAPSTNVDAEYYNPGSNGLKQDGELGFGVDDGSMVE